VFLDFDSEVALVNHLSGTELQCVQPTVLVIGDVVCDVHVVGRLVEQDATPVFSASAQYEALSGAARTACDLQALGCDVRLLSVVGADSAGRRARELLRQQRIADTFVLEDVGRPTTQRTHLCGPEGPVLCLDRRREFPPSRALASRLLECVDAVLSEVDGVLCSEDKTGLCDADLEQLVAAAQSAGCQVYVGSREKWSRRNGSSARSLNGSVSLVEVAHELQQRTP
jgi:D-beta-D-heptose 7-phosphate kinase/D-beta-D-heptose 1-phosphate adenosyltransferase